MISSLALRRILTWALVPLGLALVLRASTLFTPVFNTDEAYIAVQAHVLDDGGQLYRDTVDRKPPLVPYFYAAVFALVGRDSLIAVHVLAIMVLWLTALILAWDARERDGPSAGAWAAVLYLAAATSFLPAETQAANFEVFMLLPACLAMILARRRGVVPALVAGALVAVAALCKQTAAVTLAPVVLSVWRARPSSRLGDGASSGRSRNGWLGLAGAGLVVAVGFALVLVVAAAWLGAHRFFFWTVGESAGYLSARGVLGYALVRGAIVTAGFLAANAALCWLVWQALHRSGARPRGLASLGELFALGRDADRWVWLLVSGLGVAAGLRFFGHYYLQLLPPACLLAAPVAARLSARARARVAVAVLVPALGFALAGFFSARIHDMPDYRRLARYVRAHTAPRDRIAIWGHYPEVYWASGRMPAMRFVHTGFLTGASSGRPPDYPGQAATPGAWHTLFRDLARHPPALFIDTSPANLRDYGHYPIRRYPRLADYLARHYRRIAVVDGMDIYRPTTH